MNSLYFIFKFTKRLFKNILILTEKYITILKIFYVEVSFNKRCVYHTQKKGLFSVKRAIFLFSCFEFDILIVRIYAIDDDIVRIYVSVTVSLFPEVKYI